jgi:threonine dehydrogenase-like Zn-dependent dehydrogenase
MRNVEITGERQVAVVDRPKPKAAEDMVVVRITVAPMCTEYKAYRAGHKVTNLGHEAAGEVVEVAQPGRVRVGDRVVVMPLYACGACPLCLSGDYIHCRRSVDVAAVTGTPWGTATYAEYLVKSDWMLLPIPEDLETRHAAMACCGLGPTFGAMQRLRVDAFDTVLITGMGPVGLGGVINGVYRGARVIAVESHPYRAKLAGELGAAAVLDPGDPGARQKILDLTGGVGVDKAIDCSGAAAAQRLLIDATRRRGQVAFVGEGGEVSLHVSNDMLRKGLTLHGSWHFNLADAPRLMQAIRAVRDRIDRLVTHTFPLDRVQEAFELQLTGECGKVLLLP